jgi:serine/threonine protein kinase
MSDANRYKRVSQEFQRLASLDHDRRSQGLAQLQAIDPALANEVAEMLAADDAAEDAGFLASDGVSATTTFGRGDESIPHEAPIGSKIGPYEIRKVIDRGGMGIVYQAYDANTDRLVALKMVRTEQDRQDEREMFHEEIRAAAGLDHPNIVPVFEVGDWENRDYFTMAFVEGENLEECSKEQRLSDRRAAQLIANIARAIDYAHSKGVVHCDIKPKNILVDIKDRPRLADFGIARRLRSENGSLQRSGTPQFMAPEQIDDPGSVDARTDIHGLGATLYWCLTGRSPFTGQSALELLSSVKNNLPSSPNEVTEVHPHLSQICMKCLEKHQEERYQNASDLAVDLERFLVDEPPLQIELPLSQRIRQVVGHQASHGELKSAPASWWTLLITLIVHPLVFLIVYTGQDPIALWILLLIWAFAAGSVNYFYHWRHFWTELMPIERYSGIIMLVLNLSFLTLFLIHGPLTPTRSVSNFLGVYPPFCVVVAVALCAHAGFHAGKWMLLGGLFLPLGILISQCPYWGLPELGPLLFTALGTPIAIAVGASLRNDVIVDTERHR